jgi:pilus assembly protein CpaB
MNARSLLIILAALLVAGVTAFLARGWLSAERAQMQAPQQVVVKEMPTQAVLVAAANLPAGLFLREEHFRWQAWPADAADPNYLLQDQTDVATLVGSVVRRGIAAGEPIVAGKIVKPGDRGFLAAVLAPGMRAVTIGISETSGVAGLVFPGDRVDMLLTHDLPGGNESGTPRRAAETVLENVRVLAIGQQLNDQGESPVVSGKSATIEVTPKQAEMVTILVELGRLSLALRSLANEDAEAVGHVVMSSAAPDGEAGVPDAAAAQGTLAGADAAATADAVDGSVTGAVPVAPAPEQALPDDNPPPTRGHTYTYDNEVSRLLGITVQRGNQTTYQ